MAKLIIRQKKARFSLTIPHKLLINNQIVGIMQTPEVGIEMPAGIYQVMIQSMIPFIYATKLVDIQENVLNVLEFRDREKWWDILFAIDIILWIASCFFTLPKPWNLVYDIFTNGYFALWLVYEWTIRKKYFLMHFSHIVMKGDDAG